MYCVRKAQSFLIKQEVHRVTALL